MPQLVVWLLVIPAAAVLAIVLQLVLEWGGWHMQNLMALCQGGIDGWRTRAAHQRFNQQDRAAFLRWLSAKVGTTTGAVDETLLEAGRQSELIRILIEDEVPKAVSQCVQTHRLMAQITGASHMAEIAYESECYALRARSVWLLGHTVEFVEDYPLKFDDPRLLHNAILLRKRALPTCRRCPYIQMPVGQLPVLCPTAQLFKPEVAHASR